MAPAGRVGDDLHHTRAVETGRDIGPLAAVRDDATTTATAGGSAAAAAGLGDEDLAWSCDTGGVGGGDGAGVDEVVQGTDPVGAVGIGSAIGQRRGIVPVEESRVADHLPGCSIIAELEDPAGIRAHEDLVAVERVDGEVARNHVAGIERDGNRPLGIIDRLDQAVGLGDERPAVDADLEEVGARKPE